MTIADAGCDVDLGDWTHPDQSVNVWVSCSTSPSSLEQLPEHDPRKKFRVVDVHKAIIRRHSPGETVEPKNVIVWIPNLQQYIIRGFS